MRPLADRDCERLTLALLLGLALLGPLIRAVLLIPPAPWRAAYFDRHPAGGNPFATRAVVDVGGDRTGFGAPPEPRARFVRWDTVLHLRAEKTIAFLLTSETASSLFVDGRPAIRIEEGHGLRAEGAWVDLAAGEHRLAVESVRGERADPAALVASLDGGPPKRIPSGFLRFP